MFGGSLAEVAFLPTGDRLIARGDLVTDNAAELFELTDLATADQDPAAARTEEVPDGGDVLGIALAP